MASSRWTWGSSPAAIVPRVTATSVPEVLHRVAMRLGSTWKHLTRDLAALGELEDNQELVSHLAVVLQAFAAKLSPRLGLAAARDDVGGTIGLLTLLACRPLGASSSDAGAGPADAVASPHVGRVDPLYVNDPWAARAPPAPASVDGPMLGPVPPRHAARAPSSSALPPRGMPQPQLPSSLAAAGLAKFGCKTNVVSSEGKPSGPAQVAASPHLLVGENQFFANDVASQHASAGQVLAVLGSFAEVAAFARSVGFGASEPPLSEGLATSGPPRLDVEGAAVSLEAAAASEPSLDLSSSTSSAFTSHGDPSSVADDVASRALARRDVKDLIASFEACRMLVHPQSPIEDSMPCGALGGVALSQPFVVGLVHDMKLEASHDSLEVELTSVGRDKIENTALHCVCGIGMSVAVAVGGVSTCDFAGCRHSKIAEGAFYLECARSCGADFAFCASCSLQLDAAILGSDSSVEDGDCSVEDG